MRYWRIFFVLFLVLFIGVYIAAECLNEQLSCQAAPVVDIRFMEDNVHLSVLNATCVFEIPPVVQDFADHPQVAEIRQKSGELVKNCVSEFREKASVLGQEVRFRGQVIWSNLRNKLGSGEG